MPRRQQRGALQPAVRLDMTWVVPIFGIAVGLVTACGPGIASTDRRAVAKSALENAASKPAEIEKLLRGTVVNGGMWWNNPDCVREFPVSATIRPDQFSAFARCPLWPPAPAQLTSRRTP